MAGLGVLISQSQVLDASDWICLTNLFNMSIVSGGLQDLVPGNGGSKMRLP